MKRSPLRRKTRLRKMHPETYQNWLAYQIFRPIFMREHPMCELFTDCFRASVDPHHMKGRGYHWRLVCDERYILAGCRQHHDWIHTHQNKARELGLLLK